jgi:hypothetical protein
MARTPVSRRAQCPTTMRTPCAPARFSFEHGTISPIASPCLMTDFPSREGPM